MTNVLHFCFYIKKKQKKQQQHLNKIIILILAVFTYCEEKLFYAKI